MAMQTLVEYAKGMGNDPSRPLIEMFAAQSDILQMCPMASIPGAVWKGTRSAVLPTTPFRAINESPSTGIGRIEEFQEASFVMDHHIDVDRAIVDRQGEDRRNQERQMALAAAARKWVDTFFAGNNANDPREFNGLAARSAIYSRTTANSNASGGAALSLLRLDQAINAVNKKVGKCAIVIPYDAIPLFIQAARNTSLSGFVMQTWDQVGMPKMSYAGCPIMVGYEKDDHTPVLAFNEVGAGGGAAQTASLYIIAFGEMGVHGIQHRALSIQDKGLLEDGVTYRDHLSWDVGLVDEHKYCFHRLTSWTNAAIVA